MTFRKNNTAISADDRHIVTLDETSDDKTPMLWDAGTGKQIAMLVGHELQVRSAVFSPDGTRIATASDDDTARMWDAETGKQITVFDTRKETQVAVFSPDGKLIITSSHGSTQVWNAVTGQPIGGALEGSTLALSPDGRLIVTYSDTTVLLWGTETNKQIAGLMGLTELVDSAVFSSDGKRIVTVPNGGKVARVWMVLTTEELVSTAKAAIPRCLTAAQRKEFFLPPEPPQWCIELEKWPYHTNDWKQWFSDSRAGKSPPLPAAE